MAMSKKRSRAAGKSVVSRLVADQADKNQGQPGILAFFDGDLSF